MGITIKDIAVKANVAVSTVSRALNNKFDVNPKTREKILKIMDECGYTPNGVARGLVMQKLFTLGLIIPDISNPFFAEIAVGIENRAKELGYSVIFCNTNNNFQSEKDSIKLMRNRMVDGVIVSLSKNCKIELEALKRINFPVVQIDRKISNIDCSGVFIDNRKSAYNATKYLIELGHRKIAHFTGNLNTQTGIDRLEGFKNAIKDDGISEKDVLIIVGKYNTDSGKESMREILKAKNMPTAIFAASDLQAVGALYTAGKAGLSVPEDLSIIGHDDIDISYLINPNLTTMEQPKKQLGTLAVDLLIKKIKNRSKNVEQASHVFKEKDIILGTNLVIRESTRNLDKSEKIKVESEK